MAQPQSNFIRNKLLASLAAEDLDRLRPHLEPVSLTLRQVVQQPNQPIRDIYFLESGLTSTVTGTGGNGQIEVGIMGREDMTGLPIVLHVDSSPQEVFVQVAGDALRIRADDLRPAMEESSALRGILLQYTHAFMILVAQAAACNGRHHLEERLAKWLLMAQDRLGGEDIPLTHEFLGLMLGVRRSGVTLAVGKLEESGIVRQHRGYIHVLDRAKLEAVSCPCYGIVKAEFKRVLG